MNKKLTLAAAGLCGSLLVLATMSGAPRGSGSSNLGKPLPRTISFDGLLLRVSPSLSSLRVSPSPSSSLLVAVRPSPLPLVVRVTGR